MRPIKTTIDKKKTTNHKHTSSNQRDIAWYKAVAKTCVQSFDSVSMSRKERKYLAHKALVENRQ